MAEAGSDSDAAAARAAHSGMERTLAELDVALERAMDARGAPVAIDAELLTWLAELSATAVLRGQSPRMP